MNNIFMPGVVTENLIIFGLALLLDLAFGDPPNAFHPVAWIGKMIALLEKGAPLNHRRLSFIYGMIITLLLTGTITIGVFFLLRLLSAFNTIAYIIVAALLLKSTFTLRGLRKAAIRIKNILAEGKLDSARFELRALVSRDTSQLPEPLLVSAVVESVAESSGDSFVAPLFFFLFFGVPGTIAYRIVNTFDSMIGYRGKYEYLGKFAARLDDVINFFPARLTALLFVPASKLAGESASGAWRTALREHTKTASPNAGWTLAGMAGALRARLEKPGHYVLGLAEKPLTAKSINSSLRIMQWTALLWTAIYLVTGGIRIAFRT